MSKYLKHAAMFLLVFVLAMVVYCGYVIQGARKYTSEVIYSDSARSQWRHPGGAAKKFEISIDDLSKRQIDILIKVQDPGFYNHNGIDLSTPGAGFTTITQALTKKLYFDDFRPGIAKLKQSIIARFVVNEMISKKGQLNLFINVMYLGEVDGKPVVGIDSAAKAYYRQSLSSLNESQYISLIAMLIAPNTFHLINHPEWNADRTKRIAALIAGTYKPQGLTDQFYGKLPKAVIDAGVPPGSYWGKPAETADFRKDPPSNSSE